MNDRISSSSRRKGRPPKSINLALQGGGSHGAFTWGVLDRLLQDDRIHIEAISGTSAGAMNAVCVADGLMKGGKQGAREVLEGFWRAVSEASSLSVLRRTPMDVMTGNWNLDRSPNYLLFDMVMRVASPYNLNPLNINPLRDILEKTVDFERVRSCNRMKLFISATKVSTGRVRVFERPELTIDTVMASACLPVMFQAVEIDGEEYWDGGYIGNPVLFPFAYHCTSQDVVIVQINPMECRHTPRTAQEILNRVNEITFNSGLMKELRSIEFVTRLLDDGSIDPLRYKKMLIHIIEAEDQMKRFNASSKFNTEWTFLTMLRDLGSQTVDQWIENTYESIGKESSVDLRALFE
ncbi:MAG: patatin-like phospholipase family protein [Desulfomonilia bacterium]|nr:patatin-like phospholipase family protein [Desulfomonilia bacterium]